MEEFSDTQDQAPQGERCNGLALVPSLESCIPFSKRNCLAIDILPNGDSMIAFLDEDEVATELTSLEDQELLSLLNRLLKIITSNSTVAEVQQLINPRGKICILRHSSGCDLPVPVFSIAAVPLVRRHQLKTLGETLLIMLKKSGRTAYLFPSPATEYIWQQQQQLDVFTSPSVNGACGFEGLMLSSGKRLDSLENEYLSTYQISVSGKVVPVTICIVNTVAHGKEEEDGGPGSAQPIFQNLRLRYSSSGYQITVLCRSRNLTKIVQKRLNETILNSAAETCSILFFNNQLQTPQHIFVELKSLLSARNLCLVKEELDLLPLCLMNQEARGEQTELLPVQSCKHSTEFRLSDSFFSKRAFVKMVETLLQCYKERFKASDVSLGNDSLVITALNSPKARTTLWLVDNVVTFTVQFVEVRPEASCEEDYERTPSSCDCTQITEFFLKQMRAYLEGVLYECRAVCDWCRACVYHSAPNTKLREDEVSDKTCSIEYPANIKDNVPLQVEFPGKPTSNITFANSNGSNHPIELTDACTQTCSLADADNESTNGEPPMTSFATQTNASDTYNEYENVTKNPKPQGPLWSDFESGASYQEEGAGITQGSPGLTEITLEQPRTSGGISLEYDSQRKYGRDLYEAEQAFRDRRKAELQRELARRMADKAAIARSSNIDGVGAGTEDSEYIAVTSQESDASSTTNGTRSVNCKLKRPPSPSKPRAEGKSTLRQGPLGKEASGANAMAMNSLSPDAIKDSENRGLPFPHVKNTAAAQRGDVERHGAECSSTVSSSESNSYKVNKPNVRDKTAKCYSQENNSADGSLLRPVKVEGSLAKKPKEAKHGITGSILPKMCDTMTKDVVDGRTNIDNEVTDEKLCNLQDISCEVNAERLVECGEEKVLSGDIFPLATSEEMKQKQSTCFDSVDGCYPQPTQNSGPAPVHCTGQQDCMYVVDGPAAFPTHRQQSNRHAGASNKIHNKAEGNPNIKTRSDEEISATGHMSLLATKGERDVIQDKIGAKQSDSQSPGVGAVSNQTASIAKPNGKTNTSNAKDSQERPVDVRPRPSGQQQQQEHESDDVMSETTAFQQNTYSNSVEAQAYSQQEDMTFRTDYNFQDTQSESSGQKCAAQGWAVQGARPKKTTKIQEKSRSPPTRHEGLNPNFVERHSADIISSPNRLSSAVGVSDAASIASRWAQLVANAYPTFQSVPTAAAAQRLPPSDSALSNTEVTDSPAQLPFDSSFPLATKQTSAVSISKTFLSNEATHAPGETVLLSSNGADQRTWKKTLPDQLINTLPESMPSSLSQQTSMRSLPVMPPSDSLPYQFLDSCHPRDPKQLTNSTDDSRGSLELKLSEACAVMDKLFRETQERERTAKRLARAIEEREERERREREKKEQEEREREEKKRKESKKPDKSGKASVQESPRWLCEHYQRRCKVRFPCCGKFYPCHRCHNNAGTCTGEDVKALQATHIQCIVCKNEQEISEDSHTCNKCNTKLSEYFCSKCKHYTGIEKTPYHCEQCGICRIHKDRSFHCSVCNVCLDKRLQGKHKCRADSGHDECCICLEDAFSGCQILPCSHKVHRDCAIAMLQNGVRSCPVCRHPLYTLPQTADS